MADLIGMDPDAVEASARLLRTKAVQVASLETSIGSLVSQMAAQWGGRDAQQFRNAWDQQHRPALRRVHDAIDGLAQSALNNASDQRKTSAATSGSAVGAATGVSAVGISSQIGAPRSPATMLQFAKIANGGDDVPPGWQPVGGEQLRKLGIEPESLNGTENATGLDGRVFSDGKGHYVLAFGGSKGDMWHPDRGANVDWSENYESGLTAVPGTNVSQQAQAAADVAYRLKAAVGANNMEIVGHSLGGRDAAVAAVATGAQAVTFDAAAPTDEDVLYARALRGENASFAEYALDKLPFRPPVDPLRLGVDESITNYVSLDDPLTTGEQIVGGFGGRSALGRMVVVPVVGHLHSLDSFDGRLPGGEGGGGAW